VSQHLPALANRAAVVATTTAAAALFATLPAITAADADPQAVGPVAAPSNVGVAAAALPTAAPLPAPFAPAPAVAAPVEPVAQHVPAHAPAPSTTASALTAALGKLGAPYRWGAKGPNAFDCSGLIQWAFKNAGVDLPRTSRAQSRVGAPVAKSDLRPGDLVFFYSPVSHAGIYAGGGRIVHASTSGKPVKMGDIDTMPFHSARRV
jgi:cell wall-associated NlpC family hydrolase